MNISSSSKSASTIELIFLISKYFSSFVNSQVALNFLPISSGGKILGSISPVTLIFVAVINFFNLTKPKVQGFPEASSNGQLS